MSGTEKHIIQYNANYSLCLGCQSCTLVCGLIHDGVTGPTHGRIRIAEPDYKHLEFEILSCQQCIDHPCYDVCPKKDKAMCVDKNNIAYINESECIGCGLCAKNCKFEPSRIVIDRRQKKAKKCDMCRDREGGPACVEYCPVKCIGASDETHEGREQK